MSATPAGLADRVVLWQARHGRHDLPWQNTRDPYRVWLSEVMLQQTQVATVVEYFTRFIAHLPDVAALAAAPLDQVFGLWSGLGYYSRARNLHRCAEAVVQQHGGEFPRSAAVLQTLPGIGRSTAAAIASLCFGERVAILDANVKRVLTRVLGFGGDLALAAQERRLWELATDALPRASLPRAMPVYTQGMMDLGATVCATRRPACASCPLAEICRARQAGTPEVFPVRTRTLRRSAHSVWLLWAESVERAVWLRQRPPRGVWAGLYCLPWFDSREELEASVPKALRRGLRDLEPFKHVLTHKDLYLHPVHVKVPQGAPQDATGAWYRSGQWETLGLPAPVRRVLHQGANQPNDVDG